MKIFTCTTSGGTVRDEIIGWTFEDSDLYVPRKPVGFTPIPKNQPRYDTVIEALADGWKLLSAPVIWEERQRYTEYTEHVNQTYWYWWLVKE